MQKVRGTEGRGTQAGYRPRTLLWSSACIGLCWVGVQESVCPHSGWTLPPWDLEDALGGDHRCTMQLASPGPEVAQSKLAGCQGSAGVRCRCCCVCRRLLGSSHCRSLLRGPLRKSVARYTFGGCVSSCARPLRLHSRGKDPGMTSPCLLCTGRSGSWCDFPSHLGGSWRSAPLSTFVSSQCSFLPISHPAACPRVGHIFFFPRGVEREKLRVLAGVSFFLTVYV